MNFARYCIRCGSALEVRLLFGQERPACPACGWIYFQDPKVAAGILVEDEQGAVLLVRRINEPGRGQWSIPAGFIDAHEDPARAAERECLEETGLVVTAGALLHLIAGREHDRGADIILVYQGIITGGELRAGDDADDARFWPKADLPELAFKATRVVLGIE